MYVTITLIGVWNRWADKLDSLTDTATKDPEGYLGHPVNAFKLMKRLNTEWGNLESLVLSDTTDGKMGDLILLRLCYAHKTQLFKNVKLYDSKQFNNTYSLQDLFRT